MSVVRTVRDIDLQDRQALEHVLGRSLHDDEQVVIDVVGSPSSPTAGEAQSDRALPDWCDVYAGLTDAEVDEIETAIERTTRARQIE